MPSERRGTIAPAVVITHRFWQRRFSGDPNVIGRAIRVGREAATIVAVAPPAYAGLIRGLDLDLFVVFDDPGPGEGMTDGADPVDVHTFYSDAVERVAGALGDITAAGTAFAVLALKACE